jgi:hypothetical protein
MEKNTPPRLQLKTEHLWAIIVLVGIFIFVNMHPIRPNDFWFHLAYGRILDRTGQIPLLDPFSFTMAGQPYDSVYSYWLAELLMYNLYALGGAEWSILAFSLLLTTAYGMLLLIGLMRTGNWRAAALGALFAAALGATNWNFRPQLLAYFLAVACMLGIEKFRAGRNTWVWGLVLTASMAAWVNSHGTFFVPLLLVGCWLLEAGWQALRHRELSRLAPPLKLFGFLFIGLLINPRGINVFTYLYTMLTGASVQGFVSEWQSPTFQSLEGAIFVSLLGVSLLLWGLARRRPSLAEVLSFLVFAFLGLRYARAMVWFGITQAPLISAMLQTLFQKRRPGSGPAGRELPRLNAAIALSQLFLALLSIPWLRAYWPLAPEKKEIFALDTPIRAVEFMEQEGLSGHVFSDIAFSGYISWATDAAYNVFIDPRFELYPARLWQEYIQLGGAQAGWEHILASYDVDTLMLSPQNQLALIEAAQQSVDWQQVYKDERAIIFVRQE